MNKVESIANYFIEKGMSEEKPVNPMKLQKLLYYAYGWYYALFNKKLFDADFEAWEYGPVVEKIYHDVKHYGNNPIEEPIRKMLFEEGKINLDWRPSVKDNDDELIKHLEGMWKVYSKYDATTLSKLTHNPNSPWDLTAKKFNYDIPKNIKIENNIISKHFEELKKQIEDRMEQSETNKTTLD